MKRSILIVGAALAVLGAVALTLESRPDPALAELPELVEIPAGTYSYRLAGDFRSGTRVVDGPLEERTADAPFEIMKYPVSQADYARCVADGACPSVGTTERPEIPQTHVSFLDAVSYAEWFSKQTGQRWRLPNDEEWVRAAGERFFDDAVGVNDTTGDPSARWLREYSQNVIERGEADAELRPVGAFGANSNGVFDLAGNVWEWTDTCMINAQMDEAGETVINSSTYCGVRVAQGRHRAFIIEFVRDAKVGGCAVGLPPDYLGFRLVRDSA